MQTAKKYFLTGLAAVLPVAVTIYLFFWLAVSAESLLGSMIKYGVPENWYVPGMGVAAGIILIFVIGLFMNMVVFRRLAETFERLIWRVPLVESVYGAIRDFFDFVFKGKGEGPRQVVLVKLGREPNSPKLLGFVTKDDLHSLNCSDLEDDTIAVYLPMSYQIGGFTVLVPRQTVCQTNLPLDKAMRFVMSGGIMENDKGRPSPS